MGVRIRAKPLEDGREPGEESSDVSFATAARVLALCCVVCAAAPACKPTKTPTEEPAPDAASAPAARSTPAAVLGDTCPVQVPATAVTVVNTKDGVAMYFTTTDRNIAEVRRRVAMLAKIAITTVAEEPPSARNAEVPYWEAGALPFMVPMHVLAEDVPDGARIVMKPTKTADLDNLRSYALRHGESMQLGRCSPDFLKGRPGGPVAAEDSPPSATDTLG